MISIEDPAFVFFFSQAITNKPLPQAYNSNEMFVALHTKKKKKVLGRKSSSRNGEKEDNPLDTRPTILQTGASDE